MTWRLCDEVFSEALVRAMSYVTDDEHGMLLRATNHDSMATSIIRRVR